jgi:hypothetical protein
VEIQRLLFDLVSYIASRCVGRGSDLPFSCFSPRCGLNLSRQLSADIKIRIQSLLREYGNGWGPPPPSGSSDREGVSGNCHTLDRVNTVGLNNLIITNGGNTIASFAKLQIPKSGQLRILFWVWIRRISCLLVRSTPILLLRHQHLYHQCSLLRVVN